MAGPSKKQEFGPCPPKDGYELEHKSYYSWVDSKRGKFGGHCLETILYYVPLYACEVCGKIGNNRKIKYRSDMTCWQQIGKGKAEYSEWMRGEWKLVMCMSCYNKIKAVHKKYEEVIEIFSLIRDIERELKNGYRKKCDQNNGSIA